MICSRSTAIIAAIASLAFAVPALARDPQPPPSGIVIHLFGQNSIMSNVMPTGSSAPAPAGQTFTNHASTSGGTTETAATTTQSAPAYVEPTAGQILHQMFITGDGNPAKPAAGRVAERPKE
jgi:hypothetical protein